MDENLKTEVEYCQTEAEEILSLLNEQYNAVFTKKNSLDSAYKDILDNVGSKTLGDLDPIARFSIKESEESKKSFSKTLQESYRFITTKDICPYIKNIETKGKSVYDISQNIIGGLAIGAIMGAIPFTNPFFIAGVALIIAKTGIAIVCPD